ncbi:hypothetical protein PV379_04360 [Streptomyces caniscabiei]|uniref:hypothetical protein n=1 Tax=Streptomyces caniscabiei TaxID=2746961 RepID=UPI0029B6527E|nr:hypothetical protein [Streptomyces caniscabiei]MDX2776570.1 hypothetical protein [Streptomyces caniscabiei]
MSMFKKLIKKYPTTSIVLAALLAFLSWWAWVNFSPKPLGDKMEYLGKKDYGNIFGFDSKPYSVYYYGTDMDEGEIGQYFKDVSSPEEVSQELGDGYSAPILSFKSQKGNFTLVFYSNNLDAVMRNKSFTNTKKYLVSILDSDYPTALESLR